MKSLLSIVIPCFNEEEVIGETIDRLLYFCNKIENINIELIFVDDGSKDNTLVLLKKISETDNRVKIISLARNFGHQVAVTAGIDSTNGDAVVLIDADLQDPPEVIGDMIHKWREGYDVVYGTRTDRAGESAFKRATAKSFYRLLNKLSDVPIPLDTGDFRLMSRKVVDVLKNMPEKDRFIRGMVSWVGFKQTGVLYKREKRFAGESKYPFRKMLRFAIDGILSFSSKPLKISVWIGLLCAFLALTGIISVIYLRVFTNTWVEGWTALMIAILFMGGIQLVSIGILGEYIRRIYNESKRRPLYTVEKYIGFNNKSTTIED
mgnify:CR=1 FL=1